MVRWNIISYRTKKFFWFLCCKGKGSAFFCLNGEARNIFALKHNRCYDIINLFPWNLDIVIHLFFVIIFETSVANHNLVIVPLCILLCIHNIARAVQKYRKYFCHSPLCIVYSALIKLKLQNTYYMS